MSDIAVTALRLSYLLLLWIFVLAAIFVLRRDVYGTKITTRKPGKKKKGAAPTPAPPTPAQVPATPATATPAGQVPRISTHEGQAGGPSKVVITAGKLAGTSLPLGESPIVIGRSPGCTLVLDDDYSSNRHARIYPQAGTWYLEDMGSTNGTFLDRERISEPVPINVGDPIRIGRTVLELQR